MAKINAGYEIIAEEAYRVLPDGRKDVIALGRMDSPNGAKYVTWEGVVRQNDGNEASNNFVSDYFWGHYFEKDERAAFEDYHKRLYQRYDKASYKMERLTKWNGKKWVLPQGKNSDGESNWRIIAERLAAYENTGMTPDEIKRLKEVNA